MHDDDTLPTLSDVDTLSLIGFECIGSWGNNNPNRTLVKRHSDFVYVRTRDGQIFRGSPDLMEDARYGAMGLHSTDWETINAGNAISTILAEIEE